MSNVSCMETANFTININRKKSIVNNEFETKEQEQGGDKTEKGCER